MMAGPDSHAFNQLLDDYFEMPDIPECMLPHPSLNTTRATPTLFPTAQGGSDESFQSHFENLDELGNYNAG